MKLKLHYVVTKLNFRQSLEEKKIWEKEELIFEFSIKIAVDWLFVLQD